MNISLLLTIFLPLAISLSCHASSNYHVKSPNGQLSCEIRQNKEGICTYSLSRNGKPLLNDSPLGYETAEREKIPGHSWTIGKQDTRKVNEAWKPVWGKRAVVSDRYNETVLHLEAPAAAASKGSPAKMDFTVRIYDDGLAFRYSLPGQKGKVRSFARELTEYRFSGDYTAWYYNGENANKGPEKLSECNGNRLPVMTIDTGSNGFMAVHEADLRSGEPLLLNSKKDSCTFTVVSRPGEMAQDTPSPWRVIFCGDTPGTAVDSHLLELLNPQPAPDSDFSWVKPGVCVWDWRIDGAEVEGFKYGMDYPSWVRMIDFAAKNGIKHLVLDANWYGPEFHADSDPVTGDKASDVQKIIEYGKKKKVGVWLYLNDVGGRKYPLDKTLEQYAQWGATGVKYGFMSGNMEEKNARTRHITELCARNKLLVNFHDGPVHPYGQMRTWPNAVTREYCHAQLDAHRVFTPGTFVTSVFVNMVAGPLDMNNGMFDLRQGRTTRVDESQPVPSTLVSEAARTLIVFSGATILPDIPEYYSKYPALLEFIAAQQMPWKESKTLQGKIGEYIVMARQTGKAVLIAAATNESARDLDIDLSFLTPGHYQATITQDGPNAHYLNNRETLQTSSKTVTEKDSLPVHLAPGGGACILLKPMGDAPAGIR